MTTTTTIAIVNPIPILALPMPAKPATVTGAAFNWQNNPSDFNREYLARKITHSMLKNAYARSAEPATLQAIDELDRMPDNPLLCDTIPQIYECVQTIAMYLFGTEQSYSNRPINAQDIVSYGNSGKPITIVGVCYKLAYSYIANRTSIKLEYRHEKTRLNPETGKREGTGKFITPKCCRNEYFGDEIPETPVKGPVPFDTVIGEIADTLKGVFGADYESIKIAMMIVNGKSYAEIANAIGKSIRTIQRRISGTIKPALFAAYKSCLYGI